MEEVAVVTGDEVVAGDVVFVAVVPVDVGAAVVVDDAVVSGDGVAVVDGALAVAAADGGVVTMCVFTTVSKHSGQQVSGKQASLTSKGSQIYNGAMSSFGSGNLSGQKRMIKYAGRIVNITSKNP